MKIGIIGLGGVGIMAAWRAAEAGHHVAGFEQFQLDHDRGSSFGDSRVVRRVYTDPLYTDLMAGAYDLWHEFAARFPETELFHETGGIYFGQAGSPGVTSAEAALRAAGVLHEVLPAGECRRRFPAFSFQDDEVAVYEPSMGYARASLCVRAAAKLARQYGAELRENTTVAGLEPTSSGVRLVTGTGESAEFDRVLITAGPWTGPRLEELGVRLPLVVSRQTYVHLAPRERPEQFEIGAFPVWIDDSQWTYGFPRIGELPGVKLADHSHREPTTAGTVDRTVGEADRQKLRDYASRRFPWLSPEVVYEKVCLYTNTPDEDFLIDEVPGVPGAFLIGGLSGHGFKFVPLLGQMGLELMEGVQKRDLARFRLSRFGELGGE